MKKKYVKLISCLRSNGRMPLTGLSRKLGLPVSTLHEQLKRLVELKLVKPTVLLDFSQLGFTTRAFILLAVEHSEKESLIAHLQKNDNVNSLFRINNGWSVLMECVFKDLVELEDFIEKLENQFSVKKKETLYVLDELKRETFLSIPELAENMIG